MTTGPSSMAIKPQSGGTEGEVAELKKVAAKSAQPALDYATDEDLLTGPIRASISGISAPIR